MDQNPEDDKIENEGQEQVAISSQPRSSVNSLFNSSETEPPSTSNGEPFSTIDNNLPRRAPIVRPATLLKEKRGFCLILYHHKYKDESIQISKGTEKNVEELQKVFGYYNIETVVKTDLNLSEIKDEINLLIEKDFSDYECFIIVVRTQGKENNILYAHDDCYNFLDVIENPLIYGNKSLIDKPKIFILDPVQLPQYLSKVPITYTLPGSIKRNILKCFVKNFDNITSTFIKSFRIILTDGLNFPEKKITIIDILMTVNKHRWDLNYLPEEYTIESSMIDNFYFRSLLETSKPGAKRLKSKKGFCLILNHYKYKDKSTQVHKYKDKSTHVRKGTEKDVEELQKVFGLYNIETVVKTDLNLSEIKDEIKLLIEKDFSDYECFIIMLLTHGKENNILYAHDDCYNFLEVIENPLIYGNKSLIDKPKIFILDTVELPQYLLKGPITYTLPGPFKRNILKCFATYDGFRATFIESFGSQLLNALKFPEMKITIIDILMMVNKELCIIHNLPELCTIESSMIDNFYFGSLLKSKKGFCLILNHYKYKDKSTQVHKYKVKSTHVREGTEKDVEELKKVFGLYNIETVVKTDLNLSEIKDEIKLLIEKDFSDYECFIIVLQAHDKENNILYAHDDCYNFLDVIENPLIYGNKSLIDKPKIFIIDTVELPQYLLKEPITYTLPGPFKRNILKCFVESDSFGASFIETFGSQLLNALKFPEKKITIIDSLMMVDKEIWGKHFYGGSTIESSMIDNFYFGSLLEPPKPGAKQLISKKGFCLILNQFKYKNWFYRDEVKTEVKALQQVFDLYNIETVVKTDLNLSEIKGEINLLIEKDFSDYECFIIVLLTHGKEKNSLSTLYAHHECYNFLDVIENPLIFGNKSLIDKPKIFILEAIPIPQYISKVPITYSLPGPLKRNILKCFATYGGLRSTFIESFCLEMLNALKFPEKKITIIDILMMVNKNLCEFHRLPQVCTIESSLIVNYNFGSLLKSKKGFCLILNHYEYKDKSIQIRKGTEKDVEELKKVFGHYNIETEVKDDLNLSEIKDEINLLTEKDFSDYECFIIVILTHGEENHLLHAHDKSYHFVKVIEEPLINGNTSLQRKAKIFMMQACRGKQPNTEIETNENIQNDSTGQSYTIPPHVIQTTLSKQNILRCYATYEGLIAHRNTSCGSFFIQAFCLKLMENGDKSITDIMMEVNKVLSDDLDMPQVCSTESTMNYHFCFGSLRNDN